MWPNEHDSNSATAADMYAELPTHSPPAAVDTAPPLRKCRPSVALPISLLLPALGLLGVCILVGTSLGGQCRRATPIMLSDSFLGEQAAAAHIASSTAVLHPGTVGGGVPPIDMAACLREEGTERPFTVQEFLTAQPARLKVEAVMNSQLPRPATAVTMLATATLSRKEKIAGMCDSFGTVISLVVYVGVLAHDPLAEHAIGGAVSYMQAEFDRLEAAGACILDILVVSERLQDEAGLRLFPLNVLRNLALLNARTELVMLGDLDLLAGADLKAAVNNAAQYQELLDATSDKRLVVIPTFEADSPAIATRAAAGGKSVVVQLWREAKDFRFFLESSFAPAHGDTRFDLWAESGQIYALNETADSFEPFWTGRRYDVGVYDARYRGYGKNKVQHLQMLKLLGFRYVVHPRGYLVHRPHPQSAAKKQFSAELNLALNPGKALPADANGAAGGAARGLSIFGATDRWFREQLWAGLWFRPLVTPGFRACQAVLPHWNAFDPDRGLRGR